jgi:NAD(P)H-dependent FMN reductase
MLTAVREGATDRSISGVDVRLRPALVATAIDVLEADGYLLGTPVNLGYISGALKHFFDQVYYPCLDATAGRPFGLYLHANHDASGARRAIETITTGMGWRQAQRVVEVAGEPGPAELDACRELGAAMSAGLALDG